MTIPKALLALLALTLGGLALAQELPQLEGHTVTTGRQRIELGPDGLPARWRIAPAPGELPLEVAARDVTEAMLVARGRGPLLRAPIRLEVTAGGTLVEPNVTRAAEPALEGGQVRATSTVAYGGLTAKWKLSYAATPGVLSVHLELVGEVPADEIALVIDFAGPLTKMVPNATERGKQPLPAERFLLADEEGVAWDSAAAPADSGRRFAGLPPEVYVGSADRGLLWALPAESTGAMQITRDPAGQWTWRIQLQRQPGPVTPRQLRFSLTAAPARLPGAERRREVWLGKPARVLEVPHISREVTTTEIAPTPLFEYLVGTHTGLTVRLRGNARELTKTGQHPALDRLLIGRALAYDRGVDPRGAAQPRMLARVVAALHRYGYFEADGQTEYIPPWRADPVMRYGEVFTEGGAFELTEENPVAAVRTAVYRRRATKGRGAFDVLIVVLNEGPTDVRQALYIHDGKALFGPRGNRQTERRLIENVYSFDGIPADSDWRGERLANRTVESESRGPTGGGAALWDLETNGAVANPTRTAEGLEVYGPLYVPARGFRLLFGTGH